MYYDFKNIPQGASISEGGGKVADFDGGSQFLISNYGSAVIAVMVILFHVSLFTTPVTGIPHSL